MKKKLFFTLGVILFVLAVLFVPIPKGTIEDGGTREYVALTYKIVDWNRISGREIYEKTRVYFGSDRIKSIDELWQMEMENGIDQSFDRVEGEKVFFATVLEIQGKSVLVEPLEGEEERSSCDKISFGIGKLEDIGVEVGSVVEISYDGNIMESYPAQIIPSSWRLVTDLRNMEYTESWLEKSEENRASDDLFGDVVITKIYSNCFFARTVIPMPYEIKLNGVRTDAARLSITPEPDTTIRVFMTFRSSQEQIHLPAQTLSSPKREGFAVVEWCGTELK